MFGKKKSSFQDEFTSNLIAAIRETNRSLDAAYTMFNFAETPEEVEYSIYNIKAMESKYALLLSEAKKNGLSGDIALTEIKELAFNE